MSSRYHRQTLVFWAMLAYSRQDCGLKQFFKNEARMAVNDMVYNVLRDRRRDEQQGNVQSEVRQRTW